MDYLRTLGSAAVSTLVQKSGLNLPFSLGPKVASFDGVWVLYDATKRDDGSPVSVFEYDCSTRRAMLPLARNALRKLRTTRHPDVLKFLDAVETETTIHIMTERVRTLPDTLQAWTFEREDWLVWGLHRVSVALAFINDSAGSTHGNIRTNSIFISPSGEWKLGGFELLSNPKDDAAVLYTLGGQIPDASGWASPEVRKAGWGVIKEHEPSAPDAYALGLLLHAVFNPSLPPPATALPPHPPPQPSSRGAIPPSIFPSFKKLLNPNPKGRLTPNGFLAIGMADNGFFSNNRLVKVCNGLDNFSLSSEAEKNVLLRTLNETANSFPPEFASFRVLPSLISALEFGGASAATIVPLVTLFGKNVSAADYPNVILTPLVKLFAVQDRGTRMALLDHLPEYVDKLDKKTVDSKIFPHLQTGFSDTVAVIREATVRSISLIAPLLSDRILNNELLRHLAKLQSDPEPSIRTNTCILIGRLGPTLGYNTKRKVLVPAFTRALKDTFVHARVAGLMAFMATIDCFDVEDVASKVIPNMAFTLTDKEKLVRDQAFKAIDLFIKRLESHASTMPETAAPEASEAIGITSPAQATLVNSAAGAAGALAGWAISSLGKKLATSDLQTTITAAPELVIERPTSAPQIGNRLSSNPDTPMGIRTNVASPTPSKTSTLQLGANKVPASVATAALVQKLAEEAAEQIQDNPWGNDDLIDVNDADDWSAFETAPPVKKPAISMSAGPFYIDGNSWANSFVSVPSSPAPRTTETTSKSPPIQSSPPSSSVLTKEEKAAEMQRRKEERKQRIAQLKEQKRANLE
ncbi:Protein kinase domain-containing protein [Mycena indigotica]|uniref:Protein kinase domain-containing protein n=1 Tax=Mycena indigotica TaxID=2126181 RepID=A0A8H6WEX8_9AGAR|nr:Protein kinase domain-containing protein [Mycena indigotica]KAF7315272.1 Protein kinase domain-containing protein [Mycena indigotica]